MTVLVLGGTAEARALAEDLVRCGRPVVSSLAGRVARPALPGGEVRVGGFGGVAGLGAYLAERMITAVVDATHPFAGQMSAHAAAAAGATRTPLVRLQRPGWRTHPDADRWTWVADAAEAVRVGARARRPFVTTGRQTLRSYLAWSDRAVLVRAVDPPDWALPPAWTLVRSRGPYAYDSERRLLAEEAVDLLVTKDSGGSLTRPKLDAARDLGLPVVVLARPEPPAGVAVVETVPEALAWLAALPTTAAGDPPTGVVAENPQN